MKRVTIDFLPNGSTKIEAHEFKGVGCAKATEQIEKLLTNGDSSSADKKPKPDFYAKVSGSGTMRN